MEESEADEAFFDLEMSRIRNPRLIKGEAHALPDFALLENQDFPISQPVRESWELEEPTLLEHINRSSYLERERPAS